MTSNFLLIFLTFSLIIPSCIRTSNLDRTVPFYKEKSFKGIYIQEFFTKDNGLVKSLPRIIDLESNETYNLIYDIATLEEICKYNTLNRREEGTNSSETLFFSEKSIIENSYSESDIENRLEIFRYYGKDLYSNYSETDSLIYIHAYSFEGIGYGVNVCPRYTKNHKSYFSEIKPYPFFYLQSYSLLNSLDSNSISQLSLEKIRASKNKTFDLLFHSLE